MNYDLTNDDRYRYVRRLTIRQFAVLYEENLVTGVPFDDLIDREIRDSVDLIRDEVKYGN